MTKSFSTFARVFENIIKQGDSELADFKAELERDPVKALTWAEVVMGKVARARIAKFYLNSANHWHEAFLAGTLEGKQPKTLEAYIKHIRKNAEYNTINKARFTSQSTSISANKMEREEIAAYAEIAAELLYL